MQNTIRFIFGCHSHQPVGNFEKIFRLAYDQAYKPFVDVLQEFPDVKCTLHYTGPLLDWFETNEPAFLGLLRELALAGQIEIMGGAYYEPLLCTIPERDAIGQIQRMAAFCEKHFGAPPAGMWLAERVWEPHMPRILHAAGIRYAALDDMHFLCSGLAPEDLFGYYITEDEGKSIAVFPILEKLRYIIPFHQVPETIDYLRENATPDGARCAVLHDDGEKFGIWPETHRSVYEKGWLREFFTALTDHRDWLHCTTYSDYLAQVPPRGRTYLTCASYMEMMEWALPVPTQRTMHEVVTALKEDAPLYEKARLFVRGGFWRNFLAKYPESNSMQKKMLRLSDRLDLVRRRNDPRVAEATRLLYEGQCNCAYWHGVFGGLYLNHLRTAIYERLLGAERLLDALAHRATDWVRCDVADLDGDGRPEAELANAHVTASFSPHDGGSLYELSFKDRAFNLANTLARREELYHDALRTGRVHVGEIGEGDQSIHEIVRAKEAGLDKLLVYDPYRRVCLRDHFLPLDITVEQLWAGNDREMGDFLTAAYTLQKGRDWVELTRDGAVHDGDPLPVRVTRRVQLPKGESTLAIKYDICNHASRPLRCLFGVEFALNLLSGTAFDKYYWSEARDLGHAKLGEHGRDQALPHVALRDDWLGLECALRFDRPADVFRFPLETVSQSEGGQERIYQGSVVVPCWPLTAAPGEAISFTVWTEMRETR